MQSTEAVDCHIRWGRDLQDSSRSGKEVLEVVEAAVPVGASDVVDLVDLAVEGEVPELELLVPLGS
jgi:hypothetical protein